MNKEFIPDIIKDIQKLKDEYGKKKILGLSESLENALNCLKTENQNNDNSTIFLKPIEIIIASKHAKLYIPFLLFLKKLIDYKLISNKNSIQMLLIIKSFYEICQNNEEILLKLIEILQTITFTSFLEDTVDNYSIIYLIILKFANSKSSSFKIPIRLLITTITEHIFSSKVDKFQDEMANFCVKIYQEDKSIFEGETLQKGNFIPFLGDNFWNINVKCLVLDILIIALNGEINLHTLPSSLPNFTQRLTKDLEENLKKLSKTDRKHGSETNFIYIFIVKICKIAYAFLQKFKNFALLNVILGFLDENNPNWQKNIALELICEIAKDSELILKLFIMDPKLMLKIYDKLNSFMQHMYIMGYKNNNTSNVNLMNVVKKSKFFEKNQIYLLGDEISISSPEPDFYIPLIIEILQYTLNTYITLMRQYEISITDITDFSEIKGDKLIIKNLLEKNASNMKEILFTLLKKESQFYKENEDKKENFSSQSSSGAHTKRGKSKGKTSRMSNSNIINGSNNTGIINESLNLQTYLTIIQNLIGLYNCLNLSDIRNDYLKTLCLLTLDYRTNTDTSINKNITMGLTLLSLSKCTNILVDEQSWVILLEAIQKLNSTFVWKKYLSFNNDSISYNMEDIIKDIKNCYKIFFVGLAEDELETDNSNTTSDSFEKNENLNRLILGIRSIFIDCKNFKENEIKNIICALKKCIENTIKKYTKEGKLSTLDANFFDEIQFYLVKILTIALLCIDSYQNIFGNFYEIVIGLIDSLILPDFSFELITTYLTEIILKHREDIKFDNNIDNNTDKTQKLSVEIEEISSNSESNLISASREHAAPKISQLLSDEKWQKLLFSLILDILKNENFVKKAGKHIFPVLSKIIQKCGNVLDIYGWNSVIEILEIMVKVDMEEVFNILTQMLNDFNMCLTPYNIVNLAKILEVLSLYEKDTKICFSSVELFWTCANILDNFQQNKVDLNSTIKKQLENEYENAFKKGGKQKYLNYVWETIFEKLPIINKDLRSDVRKSGINVLTEIFVAKLQILSQETSTNIMDKVFIKVFNENAEKYIENEKEIEEDKGKNNIKNINEDNINKKEENEDSKENSINQQPRQSIVQNELEISLEISIFSMIKVLKSYYSIKNVDINNDLFNDFLNKNNTIIPYGTTQLNIDILKGILEVKKGNNIPIILNSLDTYFDIMNSIGKFILSEKFTPKMFNKSLSQRLLKSILNNLKLIFLNPDYLEEISNSEKEKISKNKKKDIFQKIFSILNCLFKSILICEKSFIEQNKRRIIDLEREILEFLGEMGKNRKKEFWEIFGEKKEIYNYIIELIYYDFNFPHNECICRKALDIIEKIISDDDEKELDIIYSLIEKLKVILIQRNQTEVVGSFVETTPKTNPNNDERLIFTYYIKEFNKILEHYNDILSNKNNKYDYNDIAEFYEKLIDIFETTLKQSILGFNNVNKKYLDILLESSNQINNDIINCIVKSLIPNFIIFFDKFSTDEENRLKGEKIQEKLLKLFDYGCDINSNSKSASNMTNEANISKICILSLIELCKYRSEEENLEQFKASFGEENNDKFKDYVENKKKISKICLPILIKKCTKLLKTFMEDEIKSGDMPLNRNRINDTVIILESLKNLDVYQSSEEIEKESSEVTFLDVLKKCKKIHLFYLQPVLADFIEAKEKEIKNLVKEIFIEITNVIGLDV